MSKTPANTVVVTGAVSGDVLVGITPRNLGLIIRVDEKQSAGLGGRIIGSFSVIAVGSGEYADALRQVFVKQASFTSIELVEAVRASGAVDFTHVVNANGFWRIDAGEIRAWLSGVSSE